MTGERTFEIRLADIEARMTLFDSPRVPATAASDFEAALGTARRATAPENVRILVDQSAARYGVDPAFVRAVLETESNFDARARSRAGAVGYMQIMPETAHDLGIDPNDPAQNVLGGTAYLASLLRRFGNDPALAAAAYNAGPGAVEHYGGVPPFGETQRYVAKVLAIYGRGGS